VLAPLTALLVARVTLYPALRSAVRRVAAVVAGALVAVALSAVAGSTWWSLGITIVASACPSPRPTDGGWTNDLEDVRPALVDKRGSTGSAGTAHSSTQEGNDGTASGPLRRAQHDPYQPHT
jgi:hypothetical protein